MTTAESDGAPENPQAATGVGPVTGRRWGLLRRVDAPDFDRPDENYMTRYVLVETPWFGVFVHRLDKPDPRPTLHDHPWPFLSLVLRGGYSENAAGTTTGARVRTWRAGSLHRMRTTDFHTITSLRRVPTWTLLAVGRRRPEPSWGYLDTQGWTPWNQHPHNDEFTQAKKRREVGSAASMYRFVFDEPDVTVIKRCTDGQETSFMPSSFSTPKDTALGRG